MKIIRLFAVLFLLGLSADLFAGRQRRRETKKRNEQNASSNHYLGDEKKEGRFGSRRRKIGGSKAQYF